MKETAAYMKKRPLFFAALLIVVIAAVIALTWPKAEFQWESPAQTQYDRTLIVAADIDYPPYSFIDESGQYAGHDVELIYALGAELKANIDLRLLPWNVALEGVKDGKFDVLLGVTYAENRREDMLFSIPVVSDPYVAFGRTADGSATALGDKRLCTIHGDSATEAFLIPYGLEKNASYFDTYSECFASVAAGENDYVICPYLTGSKINDAYPGISAVGGELYNSIYCICTPLDSDELRSEINSALGQLSAAGVLAQIHSRWLVDYVRDTSLTAFVEKNREALIICALALIILFMLTYFLTERHNIKKLYIQTERVRIFEETLEAPLFEYTIAGDTAVFSVRDGPDQIRRERYEHYIGGGIYKENIDEKHQPDAARLLRGEGFTDGKASFECRLRWKDLPWMWYRITLRQARSITGKPVSIIGRLENIDQTVTERDKALRLASMDPLTGLDNRSAFQKSVEERLQCPAQGFRALIMLDMDAFKTINDTFGHLTGDHVLIDVGNLLRRVFGADDIIARFGGDEFLIYLEYAPQEVLPKRIEQLQARLRELDKEETSLSCSIGAICIRENEMSVSQLIEAADEALYESKRKGKNQYTIKTA